MSIVNALPVNARLAGSQDWDSGSGGLSARQRRNLVIGVVVLVLVIIAIAIYFYRKGKKQVTIAPLPTDNVTSQQQTTGVGEADISATSTQLYNDMDGLNIAGHDLVPYQHALTYSDTDFTQLYNFFNTKYQAESGETLTGWVYNEPKTLTFFEDAWNTIRKSFLDRLGKLNLK